MKILWIAPLFNNYRYKILKELSKLNEVEMNLLSGDFRFEEKHNSKLDFYWKNINVSKLFFGIHPKSFFVLYKEIKVFKPKVILVPIENKFLFLIIFSFFLKPFFKFKLISYNHYLPKKNNFYNRLFTKFIFRLYDKIIFYTKKDWLKSINDKIINSQKSSYANNTLVVYQKPFLNRSLDNQINLIFIGSLRKDKNIKELIELFKILKEKNNNIQLKIIGDGPLKNYILKKQKSISGILYYGEILDEDIIAAHMNKSHIFINLGHSGLSIVHSFCYGLPYVASKSYLNHPPEISYLDDGENGILVDAKKTDKVVGEIENILGDKNLYNQMSLNAFNSYKKISYKKWLEKIYESISKF